MQHLLDIITSIENDLPNINPTQIYNEGWMTRLLMKQSILEKTKLEKFDFGKFNNWTSEALISSPFLKAKKCKEGYTHADIAFGDFTVDYIKSGKLEIEKEAKIFGIIEAKMKSGLSKGTRNYPENYNQASRTIACISENTHNKQNCDIYFIVVAPCKKLINIEPKVKKHFLIDQIKKRFGKSEKNLITNEIYDKLISNANQCNLLFWSYEDWLEAIIEPEAKKFLNDFYENTLKWNKIKL